MTNDFGDNDFQPCDQAWPCPQLLCLLLRDHVQPRQGLPARQTGRVDSAHDYFRFFMTFDLVMNIMG